MLDRLPGPIRRWLYAGGTRADRLRDPDAVVAALDLRPGMIVADLGPGYGHFTLRMARAVEPDGVVYALDASQGTLDDLRRAADSRGITNLVFVRVRRHRVEIPEAVDLLFVSATYHHLPDAARYFADARPFLRPGGRVAILESRRSGLLARWHGRHATTPGRVLSEMAEAGYALVGTHDIVTGYWFGLFEADASAVDEGRTGNLAEQLRSLERRRLAALTRPDLEEARSLHAADYQLITPGGATLSRAEYLDPIADGVFVYRRFEPAGELAVRMLGPSAAALRYQVDIEVVFPDGHDVGRFWHTDIYERRDGQWRAVWSQATRLPARKVARE